jgi:protein tyrosine/serine phosphatase
MVARLPVMREHVTQASGGRIPTDAALLTAMRVEAEYLEEAFKIMRADHGSLDGYLDQALGLTPELRDRIHDRLLA